MIEPDRDSLGHHSDEQSAAAPQASRKLSFLPRFSLLSLLLMMLVACLIMARQGKKYRDHLRQEKSLVVPVDFDAATGRNILWQARVGSQSYSGPVVSNGLVFVGTNNEASYIDRFPVRVDLGVMLCFRASDGKFLWQDSNEKLKTGRVHDWPYQGVTATPTVEGERLWYVSNRCELVCLDTQGFYDGEDDGVADVEGQNELVEADVVWRFDMMARLGVSPHNASCSRPAVSDAAVFVVTGNGVGEGHKSPTAPEAPSFLALDKKTGEVLWTDASPGKNILHGQWGSPVLARLGGGDQVLFPGGDGWLYSFDPRGGPDGKSKLLWKFDCNPKKSKWVLGGRGDRNNLMAAPTIHQGRVYVTTGHDPEHGEGAGRIWCIDPTKRGDVSPELVYHKSDPNRVVPHRRLLACDANEGEFTRPNPNSAAVWCYTGADLDNDGQFAFEEQMHRTMSRVVIKDGLAFATDAGGVVHCLDAKTGRGLWTYDLFATTWSTPLISAQHVYVSDEDGEVKIFKLSGEPDVAKPGGNPISINNLSSSAYGTPASANNVLYVVTRETLFAISDPRPSKK